jgi:O-antigen ligase
MWRPGFPQYVVESRATGSYYCPDHFAGIMEIAAGLGAGLLLDRGARRRVRLAGAGLIALGVLGVVLSKSRGGGLTLVVLLGAVLAWGFGQWRRSARWAWRAATVAGAVLAAVAVLWLARGYTSRFVHFFREADGADGTWEEKRELVMKRVMAESRARMIGAALRAWKEHPLWGIGPGMHQHYWPRVAARGDRDRARGLWPAELNNTFHSYNVHCDWVQLLEEYGAAGLALGLIAFGGVAAALFDVRRDGLNASAPAGGASPSTYAAALGSVFALAAMAFHSLGDFNLQMPATTWMLAVIVAAPLSMARQQPAAEA